MKVLLVTPQFAPAPGGASVDFGIYAKYLAEMEDDVEDIVVLTGRWPGAPLIETLSDGRVKVYRILPHISGGHSRMGWIVREMMRVPISLAITFLVGAFKGSDIVHVHKTRSYGGAVVAGRLLGLPVVGDVRDLFDLDIFKYSTMFVVCAKAGLEKLKNDGIAEERMIYLPVPFEMEPDVDDSTYEEMRNGTLGKASYIIYVGDMSDAKGVPELLKGIEALRKKEKEWKDLHLVLCGRDVMDENLRGRLHRSDDTHYIEQCTHAQVMGLMKHAEVVILPSKWEIFGRTCIEGVILGRKVVFPGCVPEYREMGGPFVLSEITPSAISKALDDALRAGKGPDYPLERHDARKVCKDLLGVYNRLLDIKPKKGHRSKVKNHQ